MGDARPIEAWRFLRWKNLLDRRLPFPGFQVGQVAENFIERPLRASPEEAGAGPDFLPKKSPAFVKGVRARRGLFVIRV
jgi:hypothetical protein